MPIWIVIAALGSIGLTLVLASVLRRINSPQGQRREDGHPGGVYPDRGDERTQWGNGDSGDGGGGDGGGD